MNSEQRFCGLDYRISMWRVNEALPFHAEVGYRMHDLATADILRASSWPRGITVLAGGRAERDASEFTLSADPVDLHHRTIGESQFLTKLAKSTNYESPCDSTATACGATTR